MTTSHRYVPAAAVLEDTVVGAGPASTVASIWCSSIWGQQATDFLCYNAHDPHERYHAPNILKLQGNIRTVGRERPSCAHPKRGASR